MKGYGGYYEFLKDEIDGYRGKFDDFILYIPDFFKMLTNILNEDIEREDRMKINCVLGYFVAPADVIPEEVYGPLGYVDDMFLCCLTLRELREKYGLEFLNTCWEFDEELGEVLDYSYQKSKKIVEEEGIRDEVLEYAGLK